MPAPESDFEIIELPGLRLGVHRGFEEISGVRHFFTLRSDDGSLPGLAAALETAGMGSLSAATLRQVHGNTVVLRTCRNGGAPEAAQGGVPPEGDGQATADPEVALALRTADCVPVLVADPANGAVGAAHAGWRGTALGVASCLVERMSGSLGCDPDRLVALCGPAIGPCCYEVGEEVAGVFTGTFGADAGVVVRGSAAASRPHVDLAAANRLQLARAGLSEGSIFRSRVCTACRRDLFPSYRAEGSGAGRLWSVIAGERLVQTRGARIPGENPLRPSGRRR